MITFIACSITTANNIIVTQIDGAQIALNTRFERLNISWGDLSKVKFRKTDLPYSCSHFIVETDEKSSLIGEF